MTEEQFQTHARACTHFVAGHYRRTPAERLRDIADSPYAELRPDMYGAGGFIAEFEKEIAELLGKEAAVFMPSGTMAQPIALRIWADRSGNKTVAFHPTCHLHIHEQMGYRELHHLEAVLLGTEDRLFTLDDLQAVDAPVSTLLIELPQREIGGQLPSLEELSAICEHAKAAGMRLHLDGARLWECGPYYGRPYKDIVAAFDSAYVSFYKVLGGLAGAALAGPADFIAEARIWQRRQGGNLVTQFPNAISAKLGMERHLPRVGLYVDKAAELAEILNDIPGIAVVPQRPPTNMMHLHFDAPKEAVLDAAGQIAEREKCLLVPFVRDSGSGAKTELSLGEAALDIPADRLQSLYREMMKSLQ